MVEFNRTSVSINTVCVCDFHREHRVDDQGRHIRSINEISEGTNLSLRGRLLWKLIDWPSFDVDITILCLVSWIWNVGVFWIVLHFFPPVFQIRLTSVTYLKTASIRWPFWRPTSSSSSSCSFLLSLRRMYLPTRVSGVCFTDQACRNLTFSQDFHPLVHGHVRLDEKRSCHLQWHHHLLHWIWVHFSFPGCESRL